jgi:hypothetical protein
VREIGQQSDWETKNLTPWHAKVSHLGNITTVCPSKRRQKILVLPRNLRKLSTIQQSKRRVAANDAWTLTAVVHSYHRVRTVVVLLYRRRSAVHGRLRPAPCSDSTNPGESPEWFRGGRLRGVCPTVASASSWSSGRRGGARTRSWSRRGVPPHA